MGLAYRKPSKLLWSVVAFLTLIGVAIVIRRSRPKLHRWNGRIFVAASLILGVMTLVMSPQMAIGGMLETAATSVFGAAFLFCLWNAYKNARERRFALHREWMIRTYAIGLAVTSIRPIVGVFFATSRLTGLTPHDFFGIAFWIGFVLQTVVAEAWIRRTRVELS